MVPKSILEAHQIGKVNQIKILYMLHTMVSQSNSTVLSHSTHTKRLTNSSGSKIKPWGAPEPAVQTQPVGEI